jgi:SAM domain (Sterile alpha motif)
MDIGVWLRGLGLERYEAAFRENEIDDAVLPSLTQEDLKEIEMISRRSSGSMRAESAVEPTRSENITVTWRRSAVS